MGKGLQFQTKGIYKEVRGMIRDEIAGGKSLVAVSYAKREKTSCYWVSPSQASPLLLQSEFS